jgi:hypothetical protein
MPREMGAERRRVVRGRRPLVRDEQRVHRRVAFVPGGRNAEIAEVAIQVDVLLVRSPQVGKAVRIDRVHEQDRDAAARGGRDHRLGEERDLATGATEAFDAVHRGRDDQQRPRVRIAEQGDVDRQLFAARPARVRMHVTLDGEVARLRRCDEAGSRFRVGGRERGRKRCRTWRPMRSVRGHGAGRR